MNVLFYNNNCSFYQMVLMENKLEEQTAAPRWVSCLTMAQIRGPHSSSQRSCTQCLVVQSIQYLLYVFISVCLTCSLPSFLPTGRNTIPAFFSFHGDMMFHSWQVFFIFKKLFGTNLFELSFFQCTLIIYLITFGAGFEFWKFTLPGGITAGALFELLMWGGSLLTSLPVSLWNIYT